MSSIFCIVATLAVISMLIIWISRYAVSRQDRMLGIISLFLITTATGLIGSSGVLADFSRIPPPFFIFIVMLFSLSIAISMSAWGQRMASATSWRLLIGMQGFRILPEILLWLGWKDGMLR